MLTEQDRTMTRYHFDVALPPEVADRLIERESAADDYQDGDAVHVDGGVRLSTRLMFSLMAASRQRPYKEDFYVEGTHDGLLMWFGAQPRAIVPIPIPE
jgi:hypothetical protein